MLNINFIRENLEIVKNSIKNRNLTLDIDKIISIDTERREKLKTLEALKNQRNTVSKEIGNLKKTNQDASKKLEEMKTVSQEIKERDKEFLAIETELKKYLSTIPNIPHDSVPVGPDASFNQEIRSWGEIPEFDFTPRPHWEIAADLDIIDLPRGSKITGSGFILYKGLGAKLERSLINFMLDTHTEKHNYTEIFPPFLVNRESMYGTGQLPKLEEDMYKIPDEDLFLIPTAEVPVTNIFRNEILKEKQLPIYYTAYTPCFRKEAGSYGKETKGMNRVHQFDKVELVKFVKPETSYNELESLVNNAEEILKLLEIPYRVLLLSSGDISFAAAKCYDLEAFSTGQNIYLEVSSCSNFENFQSRRANIRYKRENDQKNIYPHTLNGSGLALARIVAVILENYQQKDGSVKIPSVLIPYMGCSIITKR